MKRIPLSTARRRAVIVLALATLLGAVASLSYAIAERIALQSLREATVRKMDLYAQNLGNEMRRFEYLPEVVAADPRVQALLERPSADGLQTLVNGYLKRIDEDAGSAAIYVMDRTGLTLAASNWRQPTSFLGMNFSYRPYFQDALHSLRDVPNVIDIRNCGLMGAVVARRQCFWLVRTGPSRRSVSC